MNLAVLFAPWRPVRLAEDSRIAEIPGGEALYANPDAAEFRRIILRSKPSRYFDPERKKFISSREVVGAVRFFLFLETDLLLIWEADQAVHGTVADWLSRHRRAFQPLGLQGRFIGGAIHADGIQGHEAKLSAREPTGWKVTLHDYGGGMAHDQAALAGSRNFNRATWGEPWRLAFSIQNPPASF